MDSRMVPSDSPKEENVTEVVGPKANIMLTVHARFRSYKCIFFEGNIWLYTCRNWVTKQKTYSLEEMT
jgi:hypothetical protein